MDKLHSPRYSATIGLMEWGKLQDEQGRLDGHYNGSFSLANFDLAQAAEFIRRLLPD